MALSLDQAIILAQSKSLQSFLIKNYYMADYWQYRSYKANFLPSVNLNSTLLSYNNSSNLRYNSTYQKDEFVRTENLKSNLKLNISQNIGLTGGSLYVNSDLARMQNFGNHNYLQYSSNPITIGYKQDLFGFNKFKWQRKVEPVKYEKAKKEYIQSVESMNITTVDYFFQLALADLNCDIAEYNYHKTDTLLQIAEKRYKIGSITKSELLDLKLSKNNTSISLQEAQLKLRKAHDKILTFLMLPKETKIKLELPNKVPNLQVNAYNALKAVLENNPEILSNQLSVIEAKKNVASTRAANRFSANLNINLGINKNDGKYDHSNQEAINGSAANVYQPEFNDYQVASINVSIPILDWGKGKGYWQMAKSKQKIAETAAQQALQDFEQNTITQVLEFNIQKDKVEAAAFSQSLAAESYELSVTRFMQGKTDVLKLVNSQKAKDNAKLKYISTLSDYWNKYYALRKLTLHDFEIDKPLSTTFEDLIEGN